MCSFTTKPHGCSRVLPANTLTHSNIAAHLFHSFAQPEVHPQPVVSARPRSHRLRFGFLLPQARAYWHATQKSCTVRPVHCVPQVAPVGGTRRKPAIAWFPFWRAASFLTAMNYCSQKGSTHSRRRFYRAAYAASYISGYITAPSAYSPPSSSSNMLQ